MATVCLLVALPRGTPGFPIGPIAAVMDSVLKLAALTRANSGYLIKGSLVIAVASLNSPTMLLRLLRIEVVVPGKKRVYSLSQVAEYPLPDNFQMEKALLEMLETHFEPGEMQVRKKYNVVFPFVSTGADAVYGAIITQKVNLQISLEAACGALKLAGESWDDAASQFRSTQKAMMKEFIDRRDIFSPTKGRKMTIENRILYRTIGLIPTSRSEQVDAIQELFFRLCSNFEFDDFKSGFIGQGPAPIPEPRTT